MTKADDAVNTRMETRRLMAFLEMSGFSDTDVIMSHSIRSEDLSVKGTVNLVAGDIRTILAELQLKNDAYHAAVHNLAIRIEECEDQSAEIERLRSERDTALSRADVAEAQVKAWNDAVYVEGLPMRFVPETDFGAEVPPIPSVTTKRVTELLDEKDRLRKSLTEMITAIQDGNIDSPELGGHDDIPVHRWHEEWLYHAEQALKGEA